MMFLANLRVYVHIYIYHIDGALPPRNNASKTLFVQKPT